MSLFHYLAGPVIGGIIGYITNYLAIKMLFRPLNPIYIGPFRVPFTPGIVPRRKDELAEILGGAIVQRFFNADDLEIIFSSDYLRNAFASSIADMLVSEEKSPSDLHNTLDENDSKQMENTLKQAEEEICVRILVGAYHSDLAAVIAKEGSRVTKEHLGDGVLGKVLNDETLAVVADKMQDQMHQFILTDGLNVVAPLVHKELEAMSREPIKDLVGTVFSDKALLERLLSQAYDSFMSVYVRQIVETIDVGGMITDKVKQMGAGEVETLVLSVVKRELKYVVLLGALVGIVIGTVNSFI